jgi:DNA-binding SARP family transcriptional activator
MKQDDNLTRHVLPSNKFYPPHIDQSQSLFRATLLQAKFPDHNHSKKAIIIEAQAGQGKTTLAYQFLESKDHTYIWYQIGPEDSDPVLLLSSLLMNLRTNLSEFGSPQLTNILNEGSVGPFDLTRCANILLRDLDTYLDQDIYLVFDDLHRIEFGALTNRLFEYLLDTSPPRVHFIFISRQPLDIKGTTIRNGSQIAYLSTADLALGNMEIENLYTTVLKKEISRQDAIKIRKVTNGWIMGIILASHPISGRSRFWLNSSPQALPTTPQTGHMLDYFQEEIFAQIPQNLHRLFLQLSFLQEIPIDLAMEISGMETFGQILSELTRENYFIYNLDDQQQVFRFHHFFQEFLQQRAKDRLTETEIAAIYNLEARYYQKQDSTEKALTCYKNGGDFAAMENILREKGMDLIAKNRTFTILSLLLSIPNEILFQHRWLTLYAGLLRVDFAPQTTLPFWESARAQFTEAQENIGELIALSQTIYFHFVVSGEYHKGAELLPRAELLLEKTKATLPMPILIMAARNLASGYCFFISDMEKARHYVQIATTLAARHNIHNFIASTRFIQGYIELFCGNRAKYLREAEMCFSLFHDPLVCESNRLSMRVMNLCYLSMTGDHQNFSVQQQALQKSIDQTVVDQTIAAPYLYVWGSSNLLSLGKTQQALELLAKGLAVGSTATTDHMQSQLLQWKAFGLAISGNPTQAEKDISESARLREKAGGTFYTAFHNILAGAIYTRSKKFDKARILLEKGLAVCQTISSTYLTICALFNLSYLKHQSAGPDAALDDLETGLCLMKSNGFNHFWSWEPAMMTTLLGMAVQRDIEKDFAQSLAQSRLHRTFSDDGRPIPLLQFTLMDSFALSMSGKVLLQSKNFTPFQRELLGLLITAKGQRLPQEKIQLELWPESSPENARKSFDTLLNRLRKLLIPHLSIPIKNYLYLQKGILCLDNCNIDSLQLQKTAEAGLAHCKNGDLWQAHSAFSTAVSLWKGAMPEDTFRSEQALTFNDTLSDLMTEVGATWARNLAEADRLEEAITILERILQINSLEEDLTLMLYTFHCRNNNHLKAREILEQYRRALLRAEYTPEETDSFIDEIIRTTRVS